MCVGRRGGGMSLGDLIRVGEDQPAGAAIQSKAGHPPGEKGKTHFKRVGRTA